MMISPKQELAFPSVVSLPAGSKLPDGSRLAEPAIHINDGMTLRDWFAGQALAGLCAKDDPLGLQPKDLAARAYARADAILAARQ
jgi:hypothetical protein